MATACARRDDLSSGRLMVDLIDQVLRDLKREFVLLRQRTERAGHSTAARVEQGRLSSW